MKKVLLVIPTLEQGGGQKFVMDLAAGMDKTKFQIKVLVYYKKSNSIFDDFAQTHGIDVVYLDKKLGLHPRFMLDVKKVVEEYDPDIIHTHLHSMLYLFASYKKEQLKLHTVHTIANKETHGLQGLVRFVAYKLIGVKPVAICEAVADSISREHKIDRSKIPVIYNGVDCSRYDIYKTKSSDARLITVGNIYPVKNYLFLVDCFAKMAGVLPNIRLEIVGDGSQRAELEEKIYSLGVGDKVRITGVISDVENHLADADIYVASSIYEGLPISILEAMSAGLPIVSTSVGGVPEIVKNGENGLLVNVGDAEAYISAVMELITNLDKRKKFGAASKAMAAMYDEQITVKGYESLYLQN